VSLGPVESQINSLLGSVPSSNGDSVGAVFVSAGAADYTLSIYNGSVGGDFGVTPLISGWAPFGSFVNAASVSDMLYPLPAAVVNQAIGTTSVHEITHAATGILDLPYPGAPAVPDIMQMNGYQEQSPGLFRQRFTQPKGFLLSPTQVSALYGACQQNRDQNHLGGGSGGSGGDGGLVFFQPIIWGGEGASFGTGGWIWWPTPTPTPPSNR